MSPQMEWEKILSGNPSGGRIVPADGVQKLSAGGHIEARRTDLPRPDALRKATLTKAVMDDLGAKIRFPSPMTPELNGYPTPADADIEFVGVRSLGALAQAQARAHTGQLESPTSEWKPPVRKRRMPTEDEILAAAMAAAREGRTYEGPIH